jgi:UDP-N-acetylmuramate dehydrogenase
MPETTTWTGLDHAVCSAVPLAATTSFCIGGPADYLIEPTTLDELALAVARCADAGIPFRILGGGTDILAADGGVRGAVIRTTRLDAMKIDGNRLVCEAGVRLPRAIRLAEQHGLSGLEPLAGIPGTVGGAIATNAGGKHGSISDVLVSIHTMTRSGERARRDAADLGLGYRSATLDKQIVTEAVFELTERDPISVGERRLEILEEKTRSQPLNAWSAGCIFKNPQPRKAGELIDRAALKGSRVGRAVVSDRHANFIVNEGGATERDVRSLIGHVQRRVRKVFDIELELEIELWN